MGGWRKYLYLESLCYFSKRANPLVGFSLSFLKYLNRLIGRSYNQYLTSCRLFLYKLLLCHSLSTVIDSPNILLSWCGYYVSVKFFKICVSNKSHKWLRKIYVKDLKGWPTWYMRWTIRFCFWIEHRNHVFSCG